MRVRTISTSRALLIVLASSCAHPQQIAPSATTNATVSNHEAAQTQDGSFFVRITEYRAEEAPSVVLRYPGEISFPNVLRIPDSPWSCTFLTGSDELSTTCEHDAGGEVLFSAPYCRGSSATLADQDRSRYWTVRSGCEPRQAVLSSRR